jgi:hypothetical protein
VINERSQRAHLFSYICKEARFIYKLDLTSFGGGGKQDWRAKGVCMSSLRVYVTTTRITSGSGLQKLKNKGAYTCAAADVVVTVLKGVGWIGVA